MSHSHKAFQVINHDHTRLHILTYPETQHSNLDRSQLRLWHNKANW